MNPWNYISRLYHIFIIIPCGFVKISLEQGCNEPEPVYHSYRRGDGLMEGGWFNYTCYQGYNLVQGDLNRECQAGVFTGEAPVCSDNLALYGTFAAYPPDAPYVPMHIADGDNTTCSQTATANEPTWGIVLKERKTLHRVTLSWSSGSNVNLNSISIGIFDQGGFKTCGTVSFTSPPTNSVIIECEKLCTGQEVDIIGETEATLSSLELCEVKIYGGDFNHTCGNPPFVYGGEVVDLLTSDTVLYSCVQGFYYGGLNRTSTCQPDGTWTDVPMLCLERGADVLFTDGDTTTCTPPTSQRKLYYTKPVEITSVTLYIGEAVIWGGIVINISKGDLPGGFCYYNGPSDDINRARTFECPSILGTNVTVWNRLHRNMSVCKVYVSFRNWATGLECLRYPTGADYKGELDYTISGESCDHWSDAPPTLAINTTLNPYIDVDDAKNYCRNTNPYKNNPWCWIRNFTDWEYCQISICEDFCTLKPSGVDYNGQLNVTATGQSCRSWQGLLDEVGDHSYCRNPRSLLSSPWCYVDSPAGPTSQTCLIPMCPDIFQFTTIFSNESTSLDLWLCYYWIPSDVNQPRYIHNLVLNDTTIDDACQAYYNKTLFCYDDTNWLELKFICDDTATSLNDMISPGDTSNVIITQHHPAVPNDITPGNTSAVIITTTPNDMTSPGDTHTINITTAPLGDASNTQSKAITGIASAHDDDDDETSTPITSIAQPTISSTEIASSTDMNDVINSTFWNRTTENPNCVCFCTGSGILNESKQMVEMRINDIKRQLEIDYQKLSATSRKYNSIEDDRPSAVYAGFSAVLIMGIVMALVILPDIITFGRYLYGLKNRRIGNG